MPRPGAPLLNRLRRHTRPLHEQIEASVPILRPGAGLPEYRSYLAALLGFHRPVEAALARVDGLAALPLDLSARWKTPHLAADLETLGMTADAVRRAPDAPVLPAVTSVPAALGCMYVLEGATLGGQVVHRELSARMPEVMGRASRYLQCYGADTGSRWQSFCVVLDGSAGDADAVVDAAVDTFRTFQRWLDV